jgi:hypothetical protein
MSSDRRDPAPRPAPPDDRIRPALGAMVRLFCARFMPEVDPSLAPPDEPAEAGDAPEDLQ